MSLLHAPSMIVAQLMIDQGLGCVPGTSGGVWPIYDGSLPDEPDYAICVYDTSGDLDARMMVSGRWNEHYGINLRLRALSAPAGVAKMASIVLALDTLQSPTNVLLDGTSYTVYSLSRKSGPFNNGPEPESGRRIFTVNYTVTLLD